MNVSHQGRKSKSGRRRGMTLVMAVVFFVFALGMVAFAVDFGRVLLFRSQLQTVADSAALAVASSLGMSENQAFEMADSGAGFRQADMQKVELGTWDARKRTFTPRKIVSNAVKVTVRSDNTGSDNSPQIFAAIFNKFDFSDSATAVAVTNARDIAFVVDLSGAMNDDTESMRQLFDDFGYGTYSGSICPSKTEHLGEWLGVLPGKYAYAELTKNEGPLSRAEVPDKYRINPSDNELARKKKVYSAIIDRQIARLMPKAKPAPNSSTNYAYWEKYLDYIIEPVAIGKPKDKSKSKSKPAVGDLPGTPPAIRGTIPPNQGADRIEASAATAYRNRIGYPTYVQFMLDHGRDLAPLAGQYVPLSRYSVDCPRHEEETIAGPFAFPPRTQPMHSARRALIAALWKIKQRNASIPDPRQRDWVTIITFDTLSGGGPLVVQPLGSDYDDAMSACTELQASGDRTATRATAAGMLLATETLKSSEDGGQGRHWTNKVVVVLTGGAPDLYVGDSTEIDRAIAKSSSNDFYSNEDYPRNAALVQAMRMRSRNWRTYPVGIGSGVDYDFMDRLARLGGSADEDGKSPRVSGDLLQYNHRVTEIFEELIQTTEVRLVQ